MKLRTRILIGLCLLALLPLAVSAQDSVVEPGEEPEKIVRYSPAVSIFSNNLHIGPNVVQRAPVVCIGCDVEIEGQISDNVVVIFGKLTMNGARVRDNLVGVFSSLDIKDSQVDDTMVNVLGTLEIDRFEGSTINIGLPVGWNPDIYRFLFWLRAVALLMAFILVVGITIVVPERVERIAREAPVNYMSAFFIGLLGYLGGWILLTLLTATVIGLPAGLLFFKIVKWLGLAGIFLFTGRRLGQLLGREMSPLGAILLCFGLYSAVLITLSWFGAFGLFVIMLFKLFFWILFGIPAVGLVLITRFGTRTA